MGSSANEDFPVVQETMLEFRAGKMFFEGKRVVPDTRKGLVHIARIGAGILAIPSVTQEVGFVASSVTCIVCWVFMVVTGLLVAAV